MGVRLRSSKIRLHLSGAWGEIDIRWTENRIGGGWRAETHLPDGSWTPDEQWHAVSREHLGHHLAYINRVHRLPM